MCKYHHLISTCGHADIPWLQKCKSYNWNLGVCTKDLELTNPCSNPNLNPDISGDSEEREKERIITRYSTTECEACVKIGIARGLSLTVMGKGKGKGKKEEGEMRVKKGEKIEFYAG